MILRYLTIAVALSISQLSFAGERILADDGREVLLKDDGSWEYASEHRYGTTSSGERVRLKADGNWEVVTDMQSVTPAGGVILTDSGPAQWALLDVTIETARSQRGGGKKGVSKKTQTIFTLQFRRKPAISQTLEFTLGHDDIAIVDSDGRNYPVLSVEPTTVTLDTDGVQQVVVRADGSPHWFTTKYFQLSIAAQAVGNADAIQLKRALANVRKRDVDR